MRSPPPSYVSVHGHCSALSFIYCAHRLHVFVEGKHALHYQSYSTATLQASCLNDLLSGLHSQAPYFTVYNGPFFSPKSTSSGVCRNQNWWLLDSETVHCMPVGNLGGQRSRLSLGRTFAGLRHQMSLGPHMLSGFGHQKLWCVPLQSQRACADYIRGKGTLKHLLSFVMP